MIATVLAMMKRRMVLCGFIVALMVCASQGEEKELGDGLYVVDLWSTERARIRSSIREEIRSESEAEKAFEEVDLFSPRKPDPWIGDASLRIGDPLVSLPPLTVEDEYETHYLPSDFKHVVRVNGKLENVKLTNTRDLVIAAIQLSHNGNGVVTSVVMEGRSILLDQNKKVLAIVKGERVLGRVTRRVRRDAEGGRNLYRMEFPINEMSPDEIDKFLLLLKRQFLFPNVS